MKLMLVDDHPLFIEGLSYLLKTYGFKVVGVAHSGKEALEKARLLKPDIILMDIKMPDLSGIDTLKLLKAESPETKIAMLTSSEEDEDLFDAIRYGASGYLLKSTGAKELVELLHGLENGVALLTRPVAARILQELKRLNTDGKGSGLPPAEQDIEGPRFTQRQLEILELVAKGVTYKEAGAALGLTERTVKYHMGKIIELLHLENRSQVIAYAVKMGIVQEPHI
jgi:two-component system NarL family response regulator